MWLSASLRVSLRRTRADLLACFLLGFLLPCMFLFFYLLNLSLSQQSPPRAAYGVRLGRQRGSQRAASSLWVRDAGCSQAPLQQDPRPSFLWI